MLTKTAKNAQLSFSERKTKNRIFRPDRRLSAKATLGSGHPNPPKEIEMSFMYKVGRTLDRNISDAINSQCKKVTLRTLPCLQDTFFLKCGAGQGGQFLTRKRQFPKKDHKLGESSLYFYRMQGIHDSTLPDSIIGLL